MKQHHRRMLQTALLFLGIVFALLILPHKAQAAAIGNTRLRKVVTRSACTQDVYWTKVSGANGYQLACQNGPNSRYKVVAFVRGGNTLRYRVKNRMPYVNYTYRVRAYQIVNGQRQYSAWSQRTAFLDKEVAIYGKNVPYTSYGRFYTSSATARKNMRTIRVKTWDYRNGTKGAKYTRYWYLTVHKNLASQVKKMFNDIYKNSDKFPIHDLGGWRWDGGSRTEHADGTAIDINANENPYIVRGKVVVGNRYQPSKNPYSIAKDSKVAKILNKYGFYQGIWSTSQDYMHFSYFGT